MEHTPDIPQNLSVDTTLDSYSEYEPTPDAQTVAAYYSYVDHGSVPGHDVRDWLETEAWLLNDSHLDRRTKKNWQV